MEAPQHKKSQELDLFDLVSKELQEEFPTICISINDAIIVD